jgi:hypothetical protein
MNLQIFSLKTVSLHVRQKAKKGVVLKEKKRKKKKFSK